MVGWANAAAMLATRRWLLHNALDERALVIAAHIVGAGRIERMEGDRLRWVSA
jgi:hypothetical protein